MSAEWLGEQNGMRLALVVWGGSLGGAETLAAELCLVMREMGVDAEIVLVGPPRPLVSLLERRAIPFRTLELRRGSHVITRAKRLAELVTAAGSDGALLQSDGYLGAALRAGGYRGRIVAVEHGTLLLRPFMPAWRKLVRTVDQRSGVWALDALVGVSDFVMDAISRHPHPRFVKRIWNGIDTRRFRVVSRPDGNRESGLVAGFAGRLIPGKGALTLIEALARTTSDIRAVVAGDGPERHALERAARLLGVAGRVRFCGATLDMPAFWEDVDVGVVPSHPPHVEAFGIVATEAMACGRPVIASRNGGLPEVVADGLTGHLIDRGDDADALARALEMYAADPSLRATHGSAARRRVERYFDIKHTARSYVELFASMP
jgi:glycosyltransferase involved in cell wall biosynthesis